MPGASEQAAPEFSLQPQVWVLPATTMPSHEPAWVSQRQLGGVIELSVTPRGGARCFELWHESGPPLRVQQIQQREILQLVRFSPERDAQLFRLATGDRSRITTRLEYCGLRRDTSVTLRVTAAPDTVLRLIEKLDGLPEPRRQQAPDFGSDVTLLSQRIAMTSATP
ncbi:MAG: hypothetical protein HC872_05750 [Gammaproteobacteria bacterium]|nr:hypothetical protein [Gammaproteobacteria bacterium]